MNMWADGIMAFLVLTNLMLIGSSRLAACIRIVALQGVMLAILPLIFHEGPLTARVLFLALWSMALKGIAFPVLLNKSIRDTNARREVEPFVGYTTSLIAGVVALCLSLWAGSGLPVGGPGKTLAAAGALFTMMTGLFISVSRKKAISQVLGYLVLENGVYIFGIAFVEKVPLLVELGILLDVFVAVFVMGIVIFHINREFDHLDTEKLTTLKD
jgi:hydrogenase-4 component E